MKLRGLLVAVALTAGSIVVARSALSQDSKEGGAPAAPAAPAPGEGKKPSFKGADPREYDKAEMEKRWMETMTPNQYHERLGKGIGDWETETSMWMEPGAKPMVSKGTAKTSWLFPGGKWIKQELQGSMMGMPFQGLLVEGYDNFKKKYVGSWVDNMGTSLSTFEGNYDMEGKTLVLWGTMNEAGTGESARMVKYVLHEISADETNFQIWDMGTGESGFKVMESTYRRRK